MIRLLGFREPDSGDQMSEDPLGPGLPLVVDQWEEKSSRVQKVDYIGIEFHTDDGGYFQITLCRLRENPHTNRDVLMSRQTIFHEGL